ncbi:hypothetical protein QYF61_004478 [Mycteria americana]|uniref:RNase H type-1 domain-containing protein n=1 Tax=Mycteria americana TaxID=33587 RepID=A0AAN7MH50_MYCAM|nr:hypothetical protein QYF61_004478 [Mycteria americana]
MRAVRPWNRLPREVVEAPCLETFKVTADGPPSQHSRHVSCSETLQRGTEKVVTCSEATQTGLEKVSDSEATQTGAEKQQENINIPEEILDAVIPTVWATKRPGRAKNAVPVKLELKPRAQPGKRPVSTSAQKAEMVAGNRALELSENRRVNMYSDSKYAFGVGHARGAVWKERGLLPSQGTPIQHGKAILEVLQAVLKPKEASVIHCKAHEKGQTDIISGNRKADETAQRAALTDSKVVSKRGIVVNQELVEGQDLGKVDRGDSDRNVDRLIKIIVLGK